METLQENAQKSITFKSVMARIGKFFKTNFIFSVVVMAIVSMIFVPPDSEYGGYFEWSTIATIFLILLVVAGLININFFETVARFIVKKFKSTRSIIMCLIFLTYVSAIFNANDMSLLISVNVASLGIIFSSLSGIIALKEYIKVANKENLPKKRGAWFYIGLDTLFNVVGAIILVPLSYLIAGIF